jgi:hypothetical protein
MVDADNALLLKTLQDIRKELGEHRTLLLQSVEFGRKLERHFDDRLVGIDRRLIGIDERISGLKDDLELMIKAELMGALGNFETKIEHLLDERLGEKTE